MRGINQPMWLFTNFGFFSIVAHRTQLDFLLVRARVAADLMELNRRLPEGARVPVVETKNADYGYRCTVRRAAMVGLMAQLPANIGYDNFKTEVARVQGHRRASVYHRVWDALLDLIQG